MKKYQIHEKNEFQNVRHLVEWAGEKYADLTAYSFIKDIRDRKNPEKIKKSFRELRDDVRALGSKLLDMGLAGKHVALIGKMSYDWARVYFSVLSIGAVLVPLDRDWQAEDLADTVKKADVSLLIADADIWDKAKLIAESAELEYAPVCIGEGSDAEADIAALTAEGMAIYGANPSAFDSAEIDPNALALLVFTSGTTGKGKGVMLSQNAVLSDMSDVIPYIDFADKTVGVLPPHHTYGSSVMFIGHMMIGTEIYISAGLRYVSDELKAESPGHLILVPLYLETFYRKIQANIKKQGKEKLVANMMKLTKFLRKIGIDIRKLVFKEIRAAFGGKVKMIISGGAPINPEIIDFFEGIGIKTLNGYGITECAPIIAVNRSRHVVKGSVGSVLDIDTVRIDEPNEDGEGEILVKGPNVMLGYYKDEETTAEAMTEDGYFRTGDYGKLTGDGILYITGRKKNLIILSNGKNVYPEEIENELIATPGILEIIVYEGKSRRGMEHNAIVAEIYPDGEYIKKNGIENVYDYLHGYIEEYNKTAVPYKKITVLKVREDEFPKNTLRKIMRFKIDMSID